MIEVLTHLLALLLGFVLGIGVGLWYLKNKIVEAVGTGMNPDAMMDDAQDMLEGLMGEPDPGEEDDIGE